MSAPTISANQAQRIRTAQAVETTAADLRVAIGEAAYAATFLDPAAVADAEAEVQRLTDRSRQLLAMVEGGAP